MIEITIYAKPTRKLFALHYIKRYKISARVKLLYAREKKQARAESTPRGKKQKLILKRSKVIKGRSNNEKPRRSLGTKAVKKRGVNNARGGRRQIRTKEVEEMKLAREEKKGGRGEGGRGPRACTRLRECASRERKKEEGAEREATRGKK